jgi:hypothetical protein
MKKQFLFLFVILGVVLAISCLKEHSFENGAGPSQGTLQDDGTGDCLPKTVNGSYVVGTVLDGNVNYIEVEVDVTVAGTYTIYTDTVNGIYFRGSGVFAATGLNTVRLKGIGTPAAAGISNFVVNYGSSSCTIAVTTAATLAAFTLDGAPGGCMGATPAGTYNAGTALDATNTVTIHVTVTTAGAYNLSTQLSNGMTFFGFGTLVTGAQTIVLTGSGTPTTGGTTNFPLTVGTSTCSFTITVGGTTTPASFTVDCASANPQGTYKVGTPLDPLTNKVVLSVNVATAGTYTITATGGGMTFSASGTFAAAGPGQSVTLVATTGNPTTQGANTIQLTGGTANCSFTINVSPAGGAAVFTVDCATAPTINGTYIQGTPLTAANTMVITVNVTTIGTYSITSTAAFNMTFASAAGATFTVTGVQQVTLTGTGTPNASGTIYIPITVGANTCNFMVLVSAPAAASDYFPRTTNSNWSYEFGDVSGDSLLSKVIANTHTALGNTYNIFMANDGSGFDTLGYFRRLGNDYYHYTDLAAYIGLDNVQRVEFIFIKDNQPAGTGWTTPAFPVITGDSDARRIRFKITQKDVPITLTTSTGNITYQNTIVIEEHYEVDPGMTGTYISLDDQIGFFTDYYSRNIGWIKDAYTDEMGVTDPANMMEARRYIVF